ncbi:DNA-binding MarR family transcriptional regulator [Peptoniphilus koenoeneniae]|uniref:DNA-binding MarR family transcriptional regulator n=1 Tax=Peptoniphilus koenoeneniae TaxID=507751 RepID=A0ABU0ATT3_9FIRM|nr:MULTISPECIES: MarR family transcriptional regulator [Peptoniphilus]ERT59519.1 MarR family protein [Peptoniphilus sp. BV3C26]MDQ0274675.1 DNA-binding MarR family transcriptional regulator [Peptoniphilus koenoeneniae]
MKDYKSDKSIYENDIIDSWIEKDEDEEIVSQRYRELSKIMNPMYDFILAYSNYFSIRRDYGYGPELTMVEIHILTDIHDHPDTTVTEIASQWKRTTSAISQIVRKLINFGLIDRVNSKENGKIYHLTTTPSGEKLALAHKRYDNIDIVKTRKVLLKKFTVDELIAFDNICKEYTNILRESTKKEDD